MDSVTSASIDYLKLKKINDTLFFTFLNTYNNTIYCYDYDTKKLKKSILLSSNKKIKAYEIITWDSILSYQYWDQKITLQNGAGKILKEINVPIENNKNGYCAQPSTTSPIICRKDKFYLVGGIVTNKKASKFSHSVAQVDLSFKNYNYKLNFPKIYSDYFFGGKHYNLNISYTYNEKDNIFVFSFPASHSLISTKDFITYKEYCAGSKHIRNIPEYPYSGEDKAYDYCTENGFYYSVLYDKYNNLYYRICLLPSDAVIAYKSKRDLSIIILDKNFKIVGEQVLKNTKDFSIETISSICVTPDGLLFQKENNITNDNQISFNKYKIVKI